MGEHVAFDCGYCGSVVSAEIAGDVLAVDVEGDGVRTVLVACPECEDEKANVLARTAERVGLDEWSEGPWARLWPNPERTLSYDAPASVREDFAEAQRCLSVRAHKAAAVMVRRVLEGIAVDQGETSGVLAQRLRRLKESQAIDGRLAEWADALRVVGNDAAHSGSAPTSREDAADALSFAEALADYLYTFRAQFDRFRERRTSRETPAEPSDL